MIRGHHEYLSFLMGASAISDDDLSALGVEIVKRTGTAIRGLRIPGESLGPYRELIRKKLQPGFWNDIIGTTEILFTFKLADGTVQEFTYSPETQREIAGLCSVLSGDPIEKTSDLPRYLAANSFYREALVQWHRVTLE